MCQNLRCRNGGKPVRYINAIDGQNLPDITTFKKLPSTYLWPTTHLAVAKKFAKRNAETEIHSLNVLIF